MTTPDPTALLWPEQVAEHLGYKTTATIRAGLYLTRRHIAEEGQARPTDFPLPAETGVRRSVPARPPSRGKRKGKVYAMNSAQTTRIVTSNRWRRSDLDAMLAARKQEKHDRAAGHRDPATGRMAERSAS